MRSQAGSPSRWGGEQQGRSPYLSALDSSAALRAYEFLGYQEEVSISKAYSDSSSDLSCDVFRSQIAATAATASSGIGNLLVGSPDVPELAGGEASPQPTAGGGGA